MLPDKPESVTSTIITDPASMYMGLGMTKTQNPPLIYLNLLDVMFYIIVKHGKIVFI